MSIQQRDQGWPRGSTKAVHRVRRDYRSNIVKDFATVFWNPGFASNRSTFLLLSKVDQCTPVSPSDFRFTCILLLKNQHASRETNVPRFLETISECVHS